MKRVFADEKKRRYVSYQDSLEMVSHPRENLDADGHFVGYDVIRELLDYRLEKYDLTKEEHAALTARLERERLLDAEDDAQT